MIRQTNLIFRLGGLEVYSLTIISGPSHGQDPIVEELPTITEEIWWTDKNNPRGFGPFLTIYAAVKHYEDYYKPRIASHLSGDLIPVDFRAKKRLPKPPTSI